ncbi:hypothetical protein BDF19DRAFT_438610 [Syncephalis fuscata]|nr:hypothetical protein BDF19DRAFT_438610 [Syncephalis fuscata]
MDPYRPPPYGYAGGPPPPQHYGLGSYGRGHSGMPMGRGIGPPGGPGPHGYGPPPPQGQFGRPDGFPGRGRGGFHGRGPMNWQGPNMMEPPMNPPPGVTSLFVGGISPGISDIWMEQLLRICGNVFRWKRVLDSEQKRENGQVIELPIPSAPKETKKLIIRADEKTRAALDKYEAENQKEKNESADDQAAMEGIEALLKDMFDAAANNTLDDNVEGPGAEEEEVAPDLEPEQREIVSREIALFREQTAKRDRELEERERETRRRQEENERAARERFEPRSIKPTVLASRESRSDNSRSSRVYYGVTYAYGWVLNNSRLIEEQEIEKRITEEKERDYKDRLQSFTIRENKRIEHINREEKLETERKERREHDRVKEERRLREWSDDKEEDAALEEYYEDRSRWRKRRQEIRQRERELDERDQQREERKKREAEEAAEREKQRELADKQNELKTSTRRRTRSSISTADAGMHPDRMRMLGIDDTNSDNVTGTAMSVITATTGTFANTMTLSLDSSTITTATTITTTTTSSVPIPTPLISSGVPVKLNLAAATTTNKRTMIGGSALGEGHAGDGDEHETDEVDARKRRRLAPPPPIPPVEDPEERKRLIEKLIGRIPVEPEGLWQWSIQWDYLTETVLYEKIQGFVAKKVEEVLGVPEDELALDEEAIRLVARLWRMLIYETEARAQGIA